MQRLLTVAVAGPLALAAVFFLPTLAFLLLATAVVEIAVLEYVALGRRWSRGASLTVLPFLVPPAAWVVYGALAWEARPATAWGLLALAWLLLPVLWGGLVLGARAPVADALAGPRALAFGLPYLAGPIAALALLQRLDPWELLLLLLVVWCGDSAAFYVGSSLGRRRLAPAVSPNKTWEGALAGLVAGMAVAAAWSLWRRDGLDLGVMALAAAAQVAGQVGDLVESWMKRGAGVKDSGRLLPGHGGMLDRLDALLFAAPVFVAGVLAGADL